MIPHIFMLDYPHPWKCDLFCQIITDLKYFNKIHHSIDPNAIQPAYFVIGYILKNTQKK